MVGLEKLENLAHIRINPPLEVIGKQFESITRRFCLDSNQGLNTLIVSRALKMPGHLGQTKQKKNTQIYPKGNMYLK